MMRIVKNKMLTAILIVVGLVLITAGLILEQNTDVFEKAVRICTECIGLG